MIPDAEREDQGGRRQEIPRFSEQQTEDLFTTDREMKKSRREDSMLGDVFVWRTPDEHIAQRDFRNSGKRGDRPCFLFHDYQATSDFSRVDFFISPSVVPCPDPLSQNLLL
jgi:hypothetical protein